jgi:hypothetical protein
MKPLEKTFRACKTHPAKECGICSEQIHHSKTASRQQASLDIEKDINEDLSHAEQDWEVEEVENARMNSHSKDNVQGLDSPEEFMRHHWKGMGMAS